MNMIILLAYKIVIELYQETEVWRKVFLDSSFDEVKKSCQWTLHYITLKNLKAKYHKDHQILS